MSLAVRNDTLAALATTDGDYAPLQVNADGALYVTSSGGGGGSTQYAEDTAHSSGDTGTMSLAVRNDTLAALAGTDGDYTPLQVNADGALYVTSSGFTDVQHAEGSFHTTADIGNLALGVRRDAQTSISSNGAYAPMLFNENGALWVSDGGTRVTQHAEGGLHSSGELGNLALGVRRDAETAISSNGARAPMLFNSNGALWVHSASASTSAKQDTLIAQGAGSNTYLHQALTNTAVSAIGGTSAVVKRVIVSNPTGTAAYFRMYDNLGAAVLGTDTPDIVIWIAAGVTNSVELDATFANGVSLACTASAGDSAVDAGGPVIAHVIHQ